MINDSSILNDIKSACGIPEDIIDFDTALIMHCNSVFAGLTQMGLGPSTGFYIIDKTWNWSDLIEGQVNLHNVKTYVYLKVKLIFDPPANATLLNSMVSQAEELEWRIMTELESMKGGVVQREL